MQLVQLLILSNCLLYFLILNFSRWQILEIFYKFHIQRMRAQVIVNRVESFCSRQQVGEARVWSLEFGIEMCETNELSQINEP